MARRERTSPGARAAGRLEAALLDRAIHGTERRKVFVNGTVETWTEYDNRFGLDMLKRLMPDLYGDGAPNRFASPVISRDEAIAILERYETDGPISPDAAADGAAGLTG